MEVKEAEPVHHHIQLCTLGKSRLISPEEFCKSKALWNWSWTREEGIMVRGQGSESSKAVQQESPTCVWHSFVVFLQFFFGVLRVHQKSRQAFWGCHVIERPEKTGWQVLGAEPTAQESL